MKVQNMRADSRSAGFSALHFLLVLVIFGIIGAAGWWVYNAQQEANATLDAATKSSTPAPSQKTAKPVAAKIPAGYLEYKNKEQGFSFAYPAQWGELKETQTLGAIARLQTPSKPYIGAAAEAKDKTELTLHVNTEDDARIETSYNGAIVKPSISSSGVQWLVVAPKNDKKLMVGDLYPTDETYAATKNKQGVEVYSFKLTDDKNDWQTLAFQVKDKFVTLSLPKAASTDANESDYGKTTQQIAGTVQRL